MTGNLLDSGLELTIHLRKICVYQSVQLPREEDIEAYFWRMLLNTKFWSPSYLTTNSFVRH